MMTSLQTTKLVCLRSYLGDSTLSKKRTQLGGVPSRLYNNQIGDAGATSLATAIHANTTLTTLV
jgi:hypothetical protein